jgi:hypothetical protein
MAIKHKLPAKLKDVASVYAKAYEKARETSNALNRAKTALRNEIKDEWKRRQLPAGSKIVVGGSEYYFGATESEVVDPTAIFEMYEREEITRDQLLSVISVPKAEASKVLGADVVLDATITKVGSKADIRSNDLPIERIDDEYIEEAAPKIQKPRKKIGLRAKEKPATPRIRRRIKGVNVK